MGTSWAGAECPKHSKDVTVEHARKIQRAFWSRVDIRGKAECWNWHSARMHNGYGVACVGKARVAAHRVAYMITIGEIPPGLDLDHLCRNRQCVNPTHLEPVTRRENLQRSALTLTGRNVRKTHCVRGHDLSTAPIRPRKAGPKRVCQECQRERDAQRPERRRR